MQIFVKRPVMAIAINLVIFIIGFVSFSELPLKHQAKSPKLGAEIFTNYPGANAKIVEHRITKQIENALSGVDGIKNISSVSKDGNSIVSIKYKSDGKYNLHLGQTRDKLLKVQSELPEQALSPQLYERGESDNNLMYITIEDSSRSRAEIYDYMQRNIIDKLKIIDGVAEVGVFGEQTYVVHVEVDPLKLRELNISTNEIIELLRKEKAFASGGEIDAASGKKSVVISAEFKDVRDLENIQIKFIDSIPIYIKDVAKVGAAYKKSMLNLRVNGTDATGIYLQAKSYANPISVVNLVKNFIKNIESSIPNTMNISVLYDGTITFKQNINSVWSALWEAIVLVAIIVTVSLGSLRAAMIPMITVPLCLVASFTVMLFMGFSINPITLLALVLAVGLVVDDTVVVEDNIDQKMKTGLNAYTAAQISMKEISFAVVVMTVTLAAVYMPFAFLQDPSSYMFREFTWTLAASVLISGFVALTLSPALCAKFLVKDKQHKFFIYCERVWNKLEISYQQALQYVLLHTSKVLCLAFLLFLLGIYGYKQLPADFEPTEDTNGIYGWINVDNDVTDKVRDSWATQIENIVTQDVPETKNLMIGKWMEYNFWEIMLVDRNDRKVSANNISNRIKDKIANLAGPSFGLTDAKGSSISKTGNNLELILQYSGDVTTLLNTTAKLINNVQQLPGVLAAYSQDLKYKVRYKAIINRQVAALLGVRTLDIEDVLYTMFSGVKVTDFNFDDYDYDLILIAAEEDRLDLKAINQFFVKGSEGQSIPLGTVVDIKRQQEPSALRHYERLRNTSINISLAESVSIDKVLTSLEQLLKSEIPEVMLYKFGGEAQEFKESREAMWITFGLALAFIYLVLAALFDSFADPLIVLFTVPLSIIGAVFAVWIYGGTDNIYMQVGMITLIGLISKHGILITDFANQLRNSGNEINKAIIDASTSRLRPILMTTLAMICGAIPLLLSQGNGAVARAHIGLVLIGGMTSGTFFSLFVIPVVYKLADRIRKIYYF